jgi:hypothetical protein
MPTQRKRSNAKQPTLIEAKNQIARQVKTNTPPAREESAPPSSEPGSEQLLDLYLSLDPKQREGQFAGTACAAEKVGVSQRTIQLWIEIGKIRAVLLGGKYTVFIPSLWQHLKNQADRNIRA